MLFPNCINNWLAFQTVVRIDRNLTVPMKAESAVARAQVFAGKRVPTTGRQYCKRKPKTKNQTRPPARPRARTQHSELGPRFLT